MANNKLTNGIQYGNIPYCALKDSCTMAIKTKVLVTRFAQKQIEKLPLYIIEALRYWTETVQLIGLRETRKLPGYHDEPLLGRRSKQRSVRLNRSYRLIYTEIQSGVEVLIIEVSKHDY